MKYSTPELQRLLQKLFDSANIEVYAIRLYFSKPPGRTRLVLLDKNENELYVAYDEELAEGTRSITFTDLHKIFDITVNLGPTVSSGAQTTWSWMTDLREMLHGK